MLRPQTNMRLTIIRTRRSLTGTLEPDFAQIHRKAACSRGHLPLANEGDRGAFVIGQRYTKRSNPTVYAYPLEYLFGNCGVYVCCACVRCARTGTPAFGPARVSLRVAAHELIEIMRLLFIEFLPL